jgi:superfamily II DNA or RNA helicase
MKAHVTEDKKFIRVTDGSLLEFKQLKHSFKKRIASWRFDPRVKSGVWDGYITYVDRNNKIPVGLWHELRKMCDKYGFELELDGFSSVTDQDFDSDDFKEWAIEFFSDHPKYKPRDYQLESAIKIMMFKRSASEIATAAGKTLILFMLLQYLLAKKNVKKILIIVPNTNLILQGMEDFEEYNNEKLEYKVQPIHGGTPKIKEDSQIVFGTYQSLVKLPSEWFDEFDVIAVDEAHITQARSVKEVITKVKSPNYVFGISGTMGMKDDDASSFTLQAYLGPMINDIPAKFLIQNDYASPVFVKSVFMDYLEVEIKEKLQELRDRKTADTGAKLLNMEKRIVIENRRRFLFVMGFIEKSSKNSLVLFSDIKYGYGRKMYDWLRNNTDKRVFYVDGGTPPSQREEYFIEMEKENNRIMVASFGTLATGISIKSIYNIFLTESYKSERLIRQSIGRGMRQQEGKDKVVIIDFIDDFKYNDSNYLLKHGKARLKIYKDQGFPCKIHKISF